jgi:beta-1,4-mannosyltransferase
VGTKGPIPTREETYVDIHPPSLRADRPALVVSSTSWTPDEDFSILLDAMRRYEETAGVREDLPKMLVVVTGKGPQREEYMSRIEKMQREWKKVRCVSMWLEAEDYPVLLGELAVSFSSEMMNPNGVGG